MSKSHYETSSRSTVVGNMMVAVAFVIVACAPPLELPRQVLPCTTFLIEPEMDDFVHLSPDGSRITVGHHRVNSNESFLSLIDLRGAPIRRDYDLKDSSQAIYGLQSALWHDDQSLYFLTAQEISMWDPATDVVTPVIACADCYPVFDVSVKGAIAWVRRLPDLNSVLEVLEPGSLRVMWAITSSSSGGNFNPKWSPSGNTLLTDVRFDTLPGARLFDAESGAYADLPEAIGARLVYAQQPWLSDEELLLPDTKDKALWLYNVRTQAETLFLRFQTPNSDEQEVAKYAIDHSGRWLVVEVGSDWTYRLYALDLACLTAHG
jgi:hypothetical protein